MTIKRYIAPANTLYKNKGKIKPEIFMEERYTVQDLSTAPTRDNFIGSDLAEPRYCSRFGCGKKLNIHELRFGNKCVRHT